MGYPNVNATHLPATLGDVAALLGDVIMTSAVTVADGLLAVRGRWAQLVDVDGGVVVKGSGNVRPMVYTDAHEAARAVCCHLVV